MFEYLAVQLKDVLFLEDKKEILPRLKVLVESAIKQYSQEERIGIGFSGGVDSALLARCSQHFQLYTVGLSGSSDLEAAAILASRMKWPLKLKVLSLRDADRIIQDVVRILSERGVECDAKTVGIACVVFAVLEMAREDNVKTVMGGLGAEEIFAGYMRHVAYGENYSPEFVQQALLEGLYGLEKRDCERDQAIADHFGIRIVAPFLDKELVEYAMTIHPKLKINEKEKKIILREVAREFGIPSISSERKKIAAQYGSKFDRALLKLAKQHGFKTRKEYLASLVR